MLIERPLAQLVIRLCLSNAQLRADRDAWRALAESCGADIATLRVMLSQSMTLLHDREQAEARRTKRVVRLLDGLPHAPEIRAAIAATFADECERLRAEQDARV